MILAAAAILVAGNSLRPRPALVRCDDRGLEIDGGEPGERFAFGGEDAGALPIEPLWLRLPDLFLVVKLAEKLWFGFGRGRLVAGHRRHAGIFAPNIEVVEALAAAGVERQKAFDIGGFVETPAVLFELQMALDDCGQSIFKHDVAVSEDAFAMAEAALLSSPP